MMKRSAGNQMGWFLKGSFFFLLLMGSGFWLAAQSMTAFDYFLLGAAKFKCNACTYAVDDFGKAIRLKKDYSEAYYGRSLAYSCLEKHDLALRDIDRAIRLNSEEVLYREGKGRIRSAKGDLRGGIREFR
ncbi:MAG TPA: hypothetical protein ENJ82_02595, partial [Bacteroidetes bacterium]|nr:hypothetical protein [Bacteroidota bacterium]